MERIYSIEEIFDIMRRDNKKFFELYRFDKYQWKYFESSDENLDLQGNIDRLGDVIQNEERYKPGQTYEIAIYKAKTSTGKDKDRRFRFKASNPTHLPVIADTNIDLEQNIGLMGVLKQHDLIPGYLYRRELDQQQEFLQKQSDLQDQKIKLSIREAQLDQLEKSLKEKEQELKQRSQDIEKGKLYKVAELALGAIVEKKVLPWLETGALAGIDTHKHEEKPTPAEEQLSAMMSKIYAFTGENLEYIAYIDKYVVHGIETLKKLIREQEGKTKEKEDNTNENQVNEAYSSELHG